MHNNNTIVPYISLCSGYEGIGLGLHRCISNLRCIAYCEREAFAISNLVAKMEKGLLDEAPVFTDVTTFPWEQFAPYMAGGILSFGWPCQPVSMAGKRKATEDERWLFDIIADGISILKPGMLFAENVEGLLSAKMPDGSSVFGHCIERLERLHYKVEAGIFSASETGAPHQRKRIFILAYREEQGLEGLRRLESDFIWNDVGQDGATRGEELGNSNNHSDTEAGYAEAHRLPSEHWQKVCSGFVGGADATSWPSRPGQPQYAWEPPRVVGGELADTNDAGRQAGRDNSIPDGGRSGSHRTTSHCSNQAGAVENTKLIGRRGWDNGDEGGLRGEIQTAGSCGGGRETRLEDSNGCRGEESEYQQANLSSEPSGSDSEIVGDSSSERPYRGSEDGTNQQPEMLGEGHEAVGNSECVRLEHSGEYASMGEASGEAEGSWSESSSPAQEPNAAREREAGRNIEPKFIEAQQPMGDSTYGAESRLGISELSGLSDSELAEIREWMVKGDNRTDELRLLGNGVVPATATRAFLTLLEKLK
jgi:site-specific DNA-cytosine methylase